MRSNVDLLKTIQVGLTLADEEGDFPQDTCTWQFNFHFDVQYEHDLSASQSACSTNWDPGRTCTRLTPSTSCVPMGSISKDTKTWALTQTISPN